MNIDQVTIWVILGIWVTRVILGIWVTRVTLAGHRGVGPGDRDGGSGEDSRDNGAKEQNEQRSEQGAASSSRSD